MVENPLAMRETQIQSLGWEDPLDHGASQYMLDMDRSSLVLELGS